MPFSGDTNETALAVSIWGEFIAQISVAYEDFSSSGKSLVCSARIFQTAAREITSAAAFAPDFCRHLFHKATHIFGCRRMLREEDTPGLQFCQQRDGFLCFRDVRCKVTEEFGFYIFEHSVNDAQAIGVRRGFAHGLRCFDFRETLEKGARSFEIRVAFGDHALRGGKQFFRSATQFLRGRAKAEKILPRSAFGSCAANELHTPVLAHLRAPPYE